MPSSSVRRSVNNPPVHPGSHISAFRVTSGLFRPSPTFPSLVRAVPACPFSRPDRLVKNSSANSQPQLSHQPLPSPPLLLSLPLLSLGFVSFFLSFSLLFSPFSLSFSLLSHCSYSLFPSFYLFFPRLFNFVHILLYFFPSCLYFLACLPSFLIFFLSWFTSFISLFYFSSFLYAFPHFLFPLIRPLLQAFLPFPSFPFLFHFSSSSSICFYLLS